MEHKITTENNPGLKTKIYFTILAISFLQGIQYSPSPVLTQIQEYYPQASATLTQMLVTGPSLVGMIFALLSGVLVVKISKKRLLLISSLLTGICGFLPLFVDSFGFLFVMRMFYGVALGLATALNTAVVAEWFEGKARVAAMGFQAAMVGLGMAVVSEGAGLLGRNDFHYSYFINIIGFICFFLILFCLPETGTVKNQADEKIEINRHVIVTSIFGFLEFLFLITFTTNISMHLSGDLAGNASASGTLTAIFSVAQIIIGLCLGMVTRLQKKATLPIAMLSYTVGAIFLVLWPSNMTMLVIGALFCGFSQGVFIPTAMVEVSNAVPVASAAMASGCFTCGTCSGQLLSPIILNSLSKVLFGEVSTGHVYVIAAVGMTISAVFCWIFMMQGSTKKGERDE